MAGRVLWVAAAVATTVSVGGAKVGSGAGSANGGGVAGEVAFRTKGVCHMKTGLGSVVGGVVVMASVLVVSRFTEWSTLLLLVLIFGTTLIAYGAGQASPEGFLARRKKTRTEREDTGDG